MRFIKNYFWNAGYQVFVLIVPLITIPYISQVLGPTGVGSEAYTRSIAQYFILLGSLGLTVYGNREVAYVRDDRQGLSKTFLELLELRVVLTVGVTLLYLVLIFFLNKYRVYFLLQGLGIIAAFFDISWFFQGLEEFRIIITRNVAVKVVSVFLIFRFVKAQSDVGIYILVLVCSTLIGNLTLWPYVKKYLEHIPHRYLYPWKHLRPMIALFLPQIAMQIYLQVNKTMLGAITGVNSSGFYDSSDKIIRMILAIVTSIGTVMLPNVAHHFKVGHSKAIHNSLKFSINFTLLLAVPCTAGIIFISRQFTELFFGVAFLPVAPLMQIEALIVIAIGISSVTGYQYLLPTNQVTAYSRSVFYGAILNIVLNIPFIIFGGAIGAMISTVISEFVVTGYQLLVIQKHINVLSLFKGVWKYLLSVVPMTGCMMLASHLPIHGWIQLSVTVGVAVLTYVVSVLILRPKELISSFVSIRENGD